MLQRNTSGSPLIVMTDPPVDVGPGETIEHDELLGGFEPVDAPPVDAVAPVAPVVAEPVAVDTPVDTPVSHEVPAVEPPAAVEPQAWPPAPPAPGSVVSL